MYFNNTTWVKPPFPILKNEHFFAIGDVHGYSDELEALHEIIKLHFINIKEEALLIHLGDYIDRGANSRKVLDFLSKNSDDIKSVFLAGNHDQYLIELIQPEPDPDLDRYFINSWYENGGIETMKDLGVEGYGRLMDANNIEELRNRTIDALGSINVNFLLSLEHYYQHGNYFFVHAGINPAKKIPDQNITDLLTIREPFLSSSDPWNYSFCVVHGHSVSAPNVYAHRISTDAGIYLNGTLCAAEISENGIRFIGVTQDKNFPWRERFNNKTIDLIWGTPQKMS